MKRLFALILITVIALGAFASCTSSGKGASSDAEGKSTDKLIENSSDGSASDEIGSGSEDATASESASGSDTTKGSETTIQTTVNIDIPIDPSKKIEFGSYPQTLVTEEETVAKLSAKAGTLPNAENAQKWTSYGYYAGGKTASYMWYIDVEEENTRYRGVYFTEYRSNITAASSTVTSYQDDNGYLKSDAQKANIYWFKYEPLSWVIMSKDEETNTALVVCERIIDAQAYQDGTTEAHANNYAYSTIRKWLNETFYNTAFSDTEKASILSTEVDNSAKSTGYATSDYACDKTNDKVFLLSVAESVNKGYGFSESFHEYDSLRRKKTTDYAKAQGAYTSTSTDSQGNGWWWLRSPRNDNALNARGVYYDGYVSGNRAVNRTDCGVVPAIRVKLPNN
ncbi:MAG: hypothetical protein J6U68_05005 [Clostridia bacterium]|nr:hypothetical protein [Clostridia bacterium]